MSPLAQWSADPVVIAACVVGCIVYGIGWRRLTRSGIAQPISSAGKTPPYQLARWRPIGAVVAVAALIAASCSPIDYYSDTLFWVHMIQHLLLLMVVGPAIVIAAPVLPVAAACGWRAGMPAPRWLSVFCRVWATGSRMRNARVIAAVATLVLFIAAMWLWHLPALYDLALRNEFVHDYLEHDTFILIGILFWVQVIPSPPLRPLPGYVSRMAYLFVAVVQNLFLSIYLAFTPNPLYAPYAQLLTRPGGISALTDQRIGAGIMWVVGDMPFVLGIVVLVQIWLAKQLFAGERADEGTAAATGVGV